MTIPKYKINIMKEKKYREILIYIINGFQTPNAIRTIKKKKDGGNLISKSRLSQLITPIEKGVLIDNSQIDIDSEEGIKLLSHEKEKYNKKIWEIKECALGNLFFLYLKKEYKDYMDHEADKKKSFNEYLEKEDLLEISKKLDKQREELFPVSKETTEKNSYSHLLENHSINLTLFIEKLIIEYFQKQFKVNKYDIFKRDLTYDFEQIVDSILEAYKMSLNNVWKKNPWNNYFIFYMDKKKDRELHIFLELLKTIRDVSLADSINMLYDIKKYLGQDKIEITDKNKKEEEKSELSVKLRSGHGQNRKSDYQFATFYPFSNISLNKNKIKEELV